MGGDSNDKPTAIQITVGGQKPTLEDSIDKDRILCYAYMMLTAPLTINPEKKGLL